VQVDKACNGTPEGSPLRKLLVAIYVARRSRKWLQGVANVDFLADLAGGLLDERKAPAYLNRTKLDLKGCWF
jgi:hypothetical protein